MQTQVSHEILRAKWARGLTDVYYTSFDDLN